MGAVQNLDLESIMQLRMPRVLLATALGAGLAVSGAALQALFTNPLCEPYTLGISSGSALGAAIGATLGLDWAFAGLMGPAFAGALFFAAALYFTSVSLERRGGSGNLSLLLTGVMLGFLGSSLVALWMSFSDAEGIQRAMFWLWGDLSRARIRGSLICLFSSLWLCFLIWKRSDSLDGLLMGEEGAQSLGIDVPNERKKIVLLVSLLVGVCVSAGGMIGFVGLVVPHLARRLVGALHRGLIPICALWGAVILTGADCLARVIVRPVELPVAVVTALVGAPVFLWIMLQRRAP